jgi:hypothetical protein
MSKLPRGKSSVATAKSKPASKASRKHRSTKANSAAAEQKERFEKNVAIATELAPAVALALLDKTDQPANAPPPALECLAAGVIASEQDGKVRMQLMFENGAVLPVEMSADAGSALSKALDQEVDAQK